VAQEPAAVRYPPLVEIPARVQRPVVLITGCSSGIGRVTAERFARAGFQVFASMRRPEGGAALRERAAAEGWPLDTPALDVTSDSSVEMGVRGVLAASGGRIDVLVNNAGYYAYGPVEETSPDELRAQLETNVVGVLRVTRAVLPAMRARGQGRIVNLSSISGLVVVPGAGPYHASKFALEALTEALRYEVSGQGIQVVAVEPGPFRTALHDKQVRAAAAGQPGSPYARLMQAYEREAARMKRGDPAPVAEVIFRAATRPRPRLRWRVGPTSFSGGILRRLVPDRLYEAVLRFVFR
jgi:NAD(P)-dependent dehydrogenase (short-subunit alcohol dehydrogenase family)